VVCKARNENSDNRGAGLLLIQLSSVSIRVTPVILRSYSSTCVLLRKLCWPLAATSLAFGGGR